jgi:hypothetical protein
MRLDEIGVMTAKDETFFATEPTAEQLHALFWTPGALAALAEHEQQIRAPEQGNYARWKRNRAQEPTRRVVVPVVPEGKFRPVIALPIGGMPPTGGWWIQLHSAGEWHDVTNGTPASRVDGLKHLEKLRRVQPHVQFRFLERI